MSQRPPRLLCLSQPAVTRSIHRLEESLGCKLFTRVSRGVRLTVEGTALFFHVDSAFKSLSNGERELKRLAAFEAGTPIIGAAETPLYHFLLPKLGQFREMHPNVTLQVQGSSTHETIQMLRAEQADVVLAVSPLIDVEDLSVTELASFRDVFVAGPRFKSLAIGILPSLFAQSLLAQEGFFALDTDPTLPARFCWYIAARAEPHCCAYSQAVKEKALPYQGFADEKNSVFRQECSKNGVHFITTAPSHAASAD